MPKAQYLEVSNWLRQCPECGYENGFHVSFHREADDEEGGSVSVRLLCPSCSAAFDVGLRLRIEAVTT